VDKKTDPKHPQKKAVDAFGHFIFGAALQINSIS
jgi:hypothetical protein